jgi:hypothetical protein
VKITAGNWGLKVDFSVSAQLYMTGMSIIEIPYCSSRNIWNDELQPMALDLRRRHPLPLVSFAYYQRNRLELNLNVHTSIIFLDRFLVNEKYEQDYYL